MRTPATYLAQSCGFCHPAGLLDGVPVQACRYCSTGSAVDTVFNVVDVSTGGAAPAATPRLTTATSSCGLCGSTSIDELRERIAHVPQGEPWPLELLASIPERVDRKRVV